MRRKERILPLVFAAFVAVALLTIVLGGLGCQGSSSVTGPPTATAAANVAGTWTGTFQSDDLTSCGDSPAVVTFQQDGANVTGNIETSACGVRGNLKGTMAGSQLTGSVSMQGCVGGGFSGTVSGTAISLSIGDMYKPLVTGDKVVLPGGIVTLRR
jgi:hypothetical protein